MFGIRLVCPVDEFNASRHVGDDSLTDPPTRPPRKPAANRLACGWSLPTSSTSDSGRSSLRPGLRRHRRRPAHRRGSRLTTSTKQTSKARDVFYELACLVEALKAPALREQPWRLAERARGEGLEPRGISGGVPAAGGRRPRLPRRRRPHPRSRFPSRKSLELSGVAVKKRCKVAVQEAADASERRLRFTPLPSAGGKEGSRWGGASVGSRHDCRCPAHPRVVPTPPSDY